MENKYLIYVYILITSLAALCGFLAYHGAITLFKLLKLYLWAIMALQ